MGTIWNCRSHRDLLESADLACEFHRVISEPGAKTLAWPRGRRGGPAREGGTGGGGGGRGGGGGGGGGGGPRFSTRGSREVWTAFGHKVPCLKIEK